MSFLEYVNSSSWWWRHTKSRLSCFAYRSPLLTTIITVKASLYILIRLSSIRNLDLLSGSLPLYYNASGNQMDSGYYTTFLKQYVSGTGFLSVFRHKRERNLCRGSSNYGSSNPSFYLRKATPWDWTKPSWSAVI